MARSAPGGIKHTDRATRVEHEGPRGTGHDHDRPIAFVVAYGHRTQHCRTPALQHGHVAVPPVEQGRRGVGEPGAGMIKEQEASCPGCTIISVRQDRGATRCRVATILSSSASSVTTPLQRQQKKHAETYASDVSFRGHSENMLLSRLASARPNHPNVSSTSRSSKGLAFFALSS